MTQHTDQRTPMRLGPAPTVAILVIALADAIFGSPENALVVAVVGLASAMLYVGLVLRDR